MITNIEKLHELWEYRNRVGTDYLPRQCGKTFLRMHELAASVCLGLDNYIVVHITENRDLFYLIGMLEAVFYEYGIRILPVRGQFHATRELTVQYDGREIKIVFVSEHVAALQSKAGHFFAPDPHGIVPMGHWD